MVLPQSGRGFKNSRALHATVLLEPPSGNPGSATARDWCTRDLGGGRKLGLSITRYTWQAPCLIEYRLIVCCHKWSKYSPNVKTVGGGGICRKYKRSMMTTRSGGGLNTSGQVVDTA